MSKTTKLRPESFFCNLRDVALSFVLKETASWFNLATHLLLSDPNIVMAAGRHPIGGSVVTPIFLAPKSYRFCHKMLFSNVKLDFFFKLHITHNHSYKHFNTVSCIFVDFFFFLEINMV